MSLSTLKVKDLDEEKFNQLVDLECLNIIPVLASVGINLDKNQMIKELESFKDDEVILYEDLGSVHGFVVYKLFKDHILIKSFNLRSSNNRKTLVGLLIKIAGMLEDEPIDLIVSQCHLTNKKSLNLHRGLGFNEASKNDKFIEFQTDRENILTIIRSRCLRLQV